MVLNITLLHMVNVAKHRYEPAKCSVPCSVPCFVSHMLVSIVDTLCSPIKTTEYHSSSSTLYSSLLSFDLKKTLNIYTTGGKLRKYCIYDV